MMNRYVLDSGSSGIAKLAFLLSIMGNLATLECVKNRADLILDPGSADTLCLDNRTQRIDTLFYITVDQHVSVQVVIPNFLCSPTQPPLSPVFLGIRSGPEPYLQFFPAGRKDKNAYGVRNLAF